ncbi:hypothetical protein HFV02_05365 [Acidithiobacillus caldus]|uniref:putative PDDEXK endonuclease n=1 Tax=Acidithiobacillus caldus TaxID=33059 RepID=UPI001C066AE8|nr:hypothetical protein [Acidithiobacillus caldus]MBU2801692.1 hypothetical protein [Acidithiobacillus caldus]
MGATERSKGARGERELLGLLTDQLGLAVQRNYQARWVGGCDSLSIPGWSVEIKRRENLSIGSWWAQAQRQADRDGRRPILFFRQSRRPWKAIIDLHHLRPDTFPLAGHLAEVSLETATQLIRETLP